jgi:hypothetical protein
MSFRSYVWPSYVITGSCMGIIVMGHKKSGGISDSSSLLSAAGSSQGALAGPTPSSIRGAEEEEGEEERCEWRARPA